MFEDLPTGINAAIFIGAALVVWFAGARLAGYADAIAEETGLGQAVLGLLLLGGATSLPEIAVATTASLAGAPALSIGDLLGSAAMNVLILALADAAYRRGALTSTLASPAVLLQGVLGIILLALVLAPFVAGDVGILGIGAWSWVMAGAYLLALRIIVKARGVDAWVPAGAPKTPRREPAPARDRALSRLLGGTALAAAAILCAGFLLAKTGEALAAQTGLDEGFVGLVFLAMATSLPEVSTVLAAVRLRRYEMAIADVFGTNLFNVTIIVLVDALSPGEPVLAQVGRFAAFGALLAIVLTAIFLAGMVERRDRTILRMGYDSIAVLLCYIAGLIVLYHAK